MNQNEIDSLNMMERVRPSNWTFSSVLVANDAPRNAEIADGIRVEWHGIPPWKSLVIELPHREEGILCSNHNNRLNFRNKSVASPVQE
jgi:hypothetical protein